MIAPDMEEAILRALQIVFTTELIEKMGRDPLQLRVLRQAPLQDDPTLSAPYLVYAPDEREEKGTMRIKPGSELDTEYGSAEIGGPLRYIQYYTATCGTPLKTAREDARAAIANLTARVVLVLQNFFELTGVLGPGVLTSPDQMVRLEGNHPYLVDRTTTRIYGGESTFYGEGKVYWHYVYSLYGPHRVLTTG